MKTTTNSGVCKKSPKHQGAQDLDTLVDLAELYAESYIKYNECSTCSTLFMDDTTEFLTKLDRWADMVVFGAAVREQILLYADDVVTTGRRGSNCLL